MPRGPRPRGAGPGRSKLGLRCRVATSGGACRPTLIRWSRELSGRLGRPRLDHWLVLAALAAGRPLVDVLVHVNEPEHERAAPTLEGGEGRPPPENSLRAAPEEMEPQGIPAREAAPSAAAS